MPAPAREQNQYGEIYWISQYRQRGWSLPAPGTGERLAEQAPFGRMKARHL